MKRRWFAAFALTATAVLTCRAAVAAGAPVQVVYRFDDHRWLELKGFDCEGALWYVNKKRGIKTEVHDWGYRIFTKTYIHPSERYIVIPRWGMTGAMTVSKDYGKTWIPSRTIGDEDDGTESPDYDNIESLTVVNDQGFLLTKQGHLYMSSLPFDDPRLLPGGPGIDYSYTFRGHEIKDHIDAIRPATGENYSRWGLHYIDPRVLPELMYQYYANFQNLPDRVPEVKGYKGWTHMQCDMDAGLK